MQALLSAIATTPLPANAQRLFHGRGGLHPGSEAWTLDWYAPVWLATKFGPASADEVQALGKALKARWAALAPGEPFNWVLQQRQPLGPGSAPITECLEGSVPQPHAVSEDGALYEVQLLKGQNHGLFLDMAEGRRWVRANAHGARVLNLFAYTCAFSVAALQGGAAQVVNLDMASGPMATGRQNHRLNFAGTPTEARARFLVHDLFKSWGKVTRMGPYDLVIVDPPSHQKGSFMATKDYPRLLRRLPELLEPGGQALLCLNAPEIPESFLREQLAIEAPAMVVQQRLSNPAAFADASSDRALKVLVAHLP